MTTTKDLQLDGLSEVAQAPAYTPLRLDHEKYRGYLEEYELTTEQENELLETLFNIMRTFVEIGFGLDSVQNVFSGIVEKSLRDEAKGLDRKDSFNHLACTEGEDNKERTLK